MPRAGRIAFAFGLSTFTLSAFAATYIVPPDRELIQGSDAIVVVTAVAAHPEVTAGGGVVTISDLRIERSLKGPWSVGDVVHVTEPGGVVGGFATAVPGVPAYEAGSRYLVFTEEQPNGATYTCGGGLGQFAFRQSATGEGLLVRASGVWGFDAVSLEVHAEKPRDEQRFLAYIEGILTRTIGPQPSYFVDAQPLEPAPRGVSPSAASGRLPYLYSAAGTFYRWQSASAAFLTARAQPGADGPAAVALATSSWNGGGGDVSYSRGGRDDTAVGGLTTPDGKNAVLFDANGTETFGFASIGGVSRDGSSYTLAGETFMDPAEVDVVIGSAISGQSCLDSIVTHELGHTLGFRHADKDQNWAPGPEGACGPPLDCSSSAIMTSSTSCQFDGALQEWDRTAVSTVYGAGPPPCTAPAITSASATPASITAGATVTLAVVATGSAPLSYQWYVGSPGDIRSPVPFGGSSSVSLSPQVSTTYWVRVTGQCAPAADSAAVAVTVTPATCTPPSIASAAANPPSISAGGSTLLSVTASGTAPLSYHWYAGAPGDVSSPVQYGNASSMSIAPQATTTYWVRVIGQCDPPADSSAVTVTVTTAVCTPPEINAVSATPNSIRPGEQTTLSVAATGSDLSFQWYAGAPPDTSHPLFGGNSSIVALTPAQTSTYWVRVTSGCGAAPADGPAVTVTVTSICTPPAVSAISANPQSITVGEQATLTVASTGTSTTLQWFQGQPGDTSMPLAGATGPTVTVAPLQTTTYWVRVSSGCGAPPADSIGVTVTVNAACDPPTISQPPDQRIGRGKSAVITVNATGREPLTYAWFQGAAGDTSAPVGSNSKTLETPAVQARTEFWVRVTSACGTTADSGTIAVDVIAGRARAVRKH